MKPIPKAKMTTTKTFLIGALVAIMAAPAAHANIDVVGKYIPKAQVVGEGRMTYLFWDVYDAKLYAPQGKWQGDRPFALRLDYLRSFAAKDIAKRTLQEMRNQGFRDEAVLDRWYQDMIRIFPDVDSSTSLIGIRDQRGHAVFYQGHTRLGVIDDPQFTDLFFDIWLDTDTTAPDLRQSLLGAASTS